MSVLIGLGHRSGHGKDTTAIYMKEYIDALNQGFDVKIWTWARKLKSIAHDLYKQYGLEDMAFYDTDAGRELRNIPLPVIGKTPVEIWVDLGEGIRDKVYVHTWRDYVRDNIEADFIILADSRKPTELEICKYRVRVNNPRIPNRVGKSIDHELADYQDWTHFINNNGSKDELRSLAQSVAFDILKSEQI